MAGVGIGPTLSVFTIVVQNAVPFSKLGVATSNLTFFRQIGGSVGLAIAGTQFGTALAQELPAQLEPVKQQLLGQVPEALRPAAEAGFAQVSGGSLDLNDLTGVGQSFGTAVQQGVPEQFRAFIEPFMPQFDQAFNNAMSLAIAQTFWIGVATSLAALVVALFMRELPLRATNAAPAPAPAGGGEHERPRPPLPAAD